MVMPKSKIQRIKWMIRKSSLKTIMMMMMMMMMTKRL